MNNISKSLKAFIADGDRFGDAKLAAAIICSIIVVYITVKTTLTKGLQKLTEFLQHKIEEITNPKSESIKKGAPKIPVGRPSCTDKYISNRMNSIIFNHDELRQEGEESKRMCLDRNKLSATLDVFPMTLRGQGFEAWIATNSCSREVLAFEALGYADSQEYIKKESLKNITMTQKAGYYSSNTQVNKAIIVSRCPDMKADEAAREDHLFMNTKKCKVAVESLTKLAGEFMFESAQQNMSYSKALEIYKAIESECNTTGSVDIQQSGFTAENILGKDFFTMSKDQKGDLKINIKSASKQDSSLSKEFVDNILSQKAGDPAILPTSNNPNAIDFSNIRVGRKPNFSSNMAGVASFNYAMICSLFPNNYGDITKVIEKENPAILTPRFRKLLSSIAKSAYNTHHGHSNSLT